MNKIESPPVHLGGIISDHVPQIRKRPHTAQLAENTFLMPYSASKKFYSDSHIPIFDKMYSKRLRAYKQIGYEVTGEEKPDKHKANAIFDSGNYLETYERDLKGAESSIIICMPPQGEKKLFLKFKL